MRAYLFSFLIGFLVGVIYAALRVRSPAPPAVALVGLLGMFAGEHGLQWFTVFFR
jgi:XapX domain-containing protein